jgi:rhamnosyltransferase
LNRAEPNAVKLAAATVLYEPAVEMLDDLVPPIVADGLRFFIFLNGPVSEAVEQRLDLLSNARILRAPTNIGLGAGLNAVVRAAESEGVSHLLLLDQDSSPQAGLCAALHERCGTGSRRIAAIGPVLVPPPGEAFLPMRYARRKKTALVSEVDFLPTSGSLISLAAWREIGPFRDDYFIDGIDVEWGFRAWSRGYACVLAEDLAMVHRWGSADADHRPQILRQSDIRNYYYIRNAVSGLRLRHIPLRWKLHVIGRLAIQALALLTSRRGAASARKLIGRAIADGWAGRLGPAPASMV